MSDYKVGDYVLVRGVVTNANEFYGTIRIDVGTEAALIMGVESPDITKTDPPPPPEPTGDVRVEDKDNDFWAKSAEGKWGPVASDEATWTWADLHNRFGPLSVWERAS